MVARFLGCAVVTHWLPHTLIQISSLLVLVHKNVWCCLSSLSIQTRVFGICYNFLFNSNKKKKLFFLERNFEKKFTLACRTHILSKI